MLANKVLMMAGTPGQVYIVDRQEKCLKRNAQETRVCYDDTRDSNGRSSEISGNVASLKLKLAG